jgi:hypothetical protein
LLKVELIASNSTSPVISKPLAKGLHMYIQRSCKTARYERFLVGQKFIGELYLSPCLSHPHQSINEETDPSPTQEKCNECKDFARGYSIPPGAPNKATTAQKADKAAKQLDHMVWTLRFAQTFQI